LDYALRDPVWERLANFGWLSLLADLGQNPRWLQLSGEVEVLGKWG
jgi:hypothetical protein